LGIERAYGSYEDLLGDPDLEAVYIPLPNHLHHEWTISAALAGKHVLCEKPIAMNSAQAGEMVEACRSARVLLMEAFMYRLHPLWQEVRARVEGGEVGDLKAIQTVFSYRNLDPTNIRNVVEFGGGALYDIGCYAVDVARMMFGSEPIGVQARLVRHPDLGTDVLTSALLDFGGRVATFVCSTILEGDQRVELLGTEGRIVVGVPFNIPPDIPSRFSLYRSVGSPTSPPTEEVEVPIADPYGVQADLFSRAIRQGGPPPIPPADAIANAVALEMVFAAAEG
jgi:predicted dehydrogenase